MTSTFRSLILKGWILDSRATKVDSDAVQKCLSSNILSGYCSCLKHSILGLDVL